MSMEKDPILKLIDESYAVFEEKAPLVTKIDGLPYPEYVSLLIFADAFSDVAQNDYPTVAEKIQVPGKSLLRNVKDYFQSIDLDVNEFVDDTIGLDLLDRINDLWGENFSVDALLQYDKEALVTIVLISLGHDIKLDPSVKQLLKDSDAKEPTTASLDMDQDERRYKSAYAALSEISGLKAESRDELSEGFMDFFSSKSDEPKEHKGDQKALKLVESILKQCKLRYHLSKEKGEEGTVFRHQITIDKEHYVLKSYIISGSGHLSSVLWDKSENDFLVVVTIGYIKDYYALIAFGRQRLKAWMEKEHERSE